MLRRFIKVLLSISLLLFLGGMVLTIFSVIQESRWNPGFLYLCGAVALGAALSSIPLVIVLTLKYIIYGSIKNT